MLQCSEADDERKLLLAKQSDLSNRLANKEAEVNDQERHVTWLQNQVAYLGWLAYLKTAFDVISDQDTPFGDLAE